MVSVPVPSGIPSPNQFAPNFSGLDIASKLLNLPGCPASFFGISYQNPVAIIVLAKPITTNLPLYVPVPNARVIRTVDTISQPDKFTDSNGILIDCVGKAGIGVSDWRVQKDNVNFGNGLGNPSSPFTKYAVGAVLGADSKLFMGDITLNCDTGSLVTPVPSGFNSLNAVPSINIGVPAFNIPGYGIVNPADIPSGIPISIYINDQRVFSTTSTDNRNIVFSLPATLSNILSGLSPFSVNLTPGSTVSIYTIATLGGCQKRSRTINVTLPSLPTLRAICSALETKVASITPPSIINPTGANILNINGIQQFCASDPTNPSFIKTYGTPDLSGANIGTISLDNQSAKFSVQNGSASIDLSRLFNIASLIQGLQVSAPGIFAPPISAPSISAPTVDKTARFRDTGVSLIQIQAYLPPGYIAEPTPFGGAGTYKITRPNSTYFYAQSFSDIDRMK